MSFIYNEAVLNAASIAILKRKQEEARKLKKVPPYRGMSNGKAIEKSNKISHAERKARIVQNSIQNDVKKNSGYNAKTVR